jgi:aryl-alcohol dehydrogenase-like predicted oxidoreductase
MPAFPNRVRLGKSGLSVGPLAVSGGYRVDDKSLLRALERGVNYWYHGSLLREGMTKAIRQVVAAGQRDQVVIALQCYLSWAWYLERNLRKELRHLGLDHCDVLLLGWYNHPPGPRILERVEKLREQGMFRHVAISSHHRPLFPELAKDPRYDIFHIRYNAAHTGAERDVLPLLAKDGRPGTVAYTVTRWGSLLQAKNMPKGEAPLRGRDAYRFALSNPEIDVCMSGPANAAEMDEALAALDEGPLSSEENERIRRVGKHVYDRALRRG